MQRAATLYGLRYPEALTILLISSTIAVDLATNAAAVTASILAWDFGRRWLSAQQYRAELTELRDAVEANRVRHDKALANLVSETRETLAALEKKHNAVLSGGLMRPNRR